MTRKACFLFLGLLAASPLALLAQEAPEGGALSPFAGDFGNALWTVVIFVVLLVVLGKFAWGPILTSLQSREKFIRESLETAQRERQEAEAKLKEYLDKLAAARAEASALVDEGRRDAEVLKRKIEADAKAEGDRMIERAKREITIAKEAATRDLYTLSAKLATDMASRIVGRELNPADHERLLQEAIDGLGSAARH